jgi:hypothetical protein
MKILFNYLSIIIFLALISSCYNINERIEVDTSLVQFTKANMPSHFEQFSSSFVKEDNLERISLSFDKEKTYTIRMGTKTGNLEGITANLLSPNGKLVASNYAITAKGEMKYHEGWVYRCTEAGNYTIIIDTRNADDPIEYALGER